MSSLPSASTHPGSASGVAAPTQHVGTHTPAGTEVARLMVTGPGPGSAQRGRRQRVGGEVQGDRGQTTTRGSIAVRPGQQVPTQDVNPQLDPLSNQPSTPTTASLPPDHHAAANPQVQPPSLSPVQATSTLLALDTSTLSTQLANALTVLRSLAQHQIVLGREIRGLREEVKSLKGVLVVGVGGTGISAAAAAGSDTAGGNGQDGVGMGGANGNGMGRDGRAGHMQSTPSHSHEADLNLLLAINNIPGDSNPSYASQSHPTSRGNVSLAEGFSNAGGGMKGRGKTRKGGVSGGAGPQAMGRMESPLSGLRGTAGPGNGFEEHESSLEGQGIASGSNTRLQGNARRHGEEQPQEAPTLRNAYAEDDTFLSHPSQTHSALSHLADFTADLPQALAYPSPSTSTQALLRSEKPPRKRAPPTYREPDESRPIPRAKSAQDAIRQWYEADTAIGLAVALKDWPMAWRIRNPIAASYSQRRRLAQGYANLVGVDRYTEDGIRAFTERYGVAYREAYNLVQEDLKARGVVKPRVGKKRRAEELGLTEEGARRGHRGPSAGKDLQSEEHLYEHERSHVEIGLDDVMDDGEGLYDGPLEDDLIDGEGEQDMDSPMGGLVEGM